MCTKFAVSVILKTHTWSTFSKWALHNNAHTPKISENSPGYETRVWPELSRASAFRIPVDPDKSIEKRENSFCYPAYFQSTLTSIEKYLRGLFLNIKTRVLQHRNMPTSLEDPSDLWNTKDVKMTSRYDSMTFVVLRIIFFRQSTGRQFGYK